MFRWGDVSAGTRFTPTPRHYHNAVLLFSYTVLVSCRTKRIQIGLFSKPSNSSRWSPRPTERYTPWNNNAFSSLHIRPPLNPPQPPRPLLEEVIRLQIRPQSIRLRLVAKLVPGKAVLRTLERREHCQGSVEVLGPVSHLTRGRFGFAPPLTCSMSASSPFESWAAN